MYKNLLSDFLNSLSALIYPPLCLHCEETLSIECKIFCTACFRQLEYINPKERCLTCFTSEIENTKRICTSCLRKPSLFDRVLSPFDLIGPAETLFKNLHRGFLREVAGSLMAKYLLDLKFPLPDLIIPLPQTFFERLNEGHSTSLYLAKQLSKILNRPYKSSFNFSPFIFKLNHERETIENKRVLLIGDLFYEGGEMQRYAQLLIEENPQSLYGLTLCRSI